MPHFSRHTFRVLCTPTIALTILATLACPPPLWASDGTEHWNHSIITALQDRYDLSKTQVIRQLNAQADAKNLLPHVKQELGKSYAGSWFDNDRLKLVVATTDSESIEWLNELNVHPVLHENSLHALKRAFTKLQKASTEDSAWQRLLGGWTISYEMNALVLKVLHDSENQVDEKLQQLAIDKSIVHLKPSEGRSVLLNSILVADEYQPTDPQGYLCSFGFAVEAYWLPNDGILTAGHCGWPDHEVTNPSDQLIAHFTSSTYPPTIVNNPEPGYPNFAEDNHDYALTRPLTGWKASATINTYGGDTLIVNQYGSETIGTYVCRYGRTTGGPHCGKIQDTGVTTTVYDLRFDAYIPHVNLIEVDTCADFGDSGGPLVSLIDQGHAGAVGMTSAGSATGCPNSNSSIYFTSVSSYIGEHYYMTLKTGIAW